MKQLHFCSRVDWRNWLAQNHSTEPEGIWLVYDKKNTGKASLGYEESIREALCYGWIDSIIKRIDDERYCRKFTPRKDTSQWSQLNRQRVQKLIEEGTMTPVGLAKIEAAKRCGTWRSAPRPKPELHTPEDFFAALSRDAQARTYFESLPPSHRKQYIAWIVTAKKPDTRAKRVSAALALLAKRQKLGLK
jgi:uncharacterized protein YdeI (YjbR/CyaY-like superfamily)